MRFFVDNNIAPRLARGFNQFVVGEHEFVHLRDRFAANTPDVDWMRERYGAITSRQPAVQQAKGRGYPYGMYLNFRSEDWRIDARSSEQKLRRQLIERRAVDCTLPTCENRVKSSGEIRLQPSPL